MNKYLPPIISILIILCSWWLVNTFHLVNPLFIPDVFQTLTSFVDLFKSSSFYNSLLLTLFRALTGLILSIIIGVPAGLILSRFSQLNKYLEFPIEFFRAIPASALFPLFILFFGIGDMSKIAVACYACSLIILVNAFYGGLPTQEKLARINMLITFKATPYQVFIYAIIRDAFPNISVGVRICLSYSFALVVVTEMFLSANEGLGKLVYDFYLQYRIPEMYATIIAIGLVGYFLNKGYLVIERKIIFWL